MHWITDTIRDSLALLRRERFWSVVLGIFILIFWGNTLTWPAMLLVGAILFHDSIRDIFEGLKSFLSRTEEMEVSVGQNRSFKFSGRNVSDFLQKTTDEVKSSLKPLTDDQVELFLYIIQDGDVRRYALGEGPLKFSRLRPRTVLHWDLRDLREMGLARPEERGSWRETAHLFITPFGELANTVFFEGRKYNRQYIEQYLTERAHQSSSRERDA